MVLPNLSGLSHAATRVCRPCATDQVFDDWDTGLQEWDGEPRKLTDKCTICIQPLDRASTNCPEEFNCKKVLFLKNCEHVFHLACIAQVAQRGRLECPNCKTRFANEDIQEMKTECVAAGLKWNVRFGDDASSSDDDDEDDDAPPPARTRRNLEQLQNAIQYGGTGVNEDDAIAVFEGMTADDNYGGLALGEDRTPLFMFLIRELARSEPGGNSATYLKLLLDATLTHPVTEQFDALNRGLAKLEQRTTETFTGRNVLHELADVSEDKWNVDFERYARAILYIMQHDPYRPFGVGPSGYVLDADQRDVNGVTPLLHAAWNNNVPMVRLLLDEFDADQTATADFGDLGTHGLREIARLRTARYSDGVHAYLEYRNRRAQRPRSVGRHGGVAT